MHELLTVCAPLHCVSVLPDCVCGCGTVVRYLELLRHFLPLFLHIRPRPQSRRGRTLTTKSGIDKRPNPTWRHHIKGIDNELTGQRWVIAAVTHHLELSVSPWLLSGLIWIKNCPISILPLPSEMSSNPFLRFKLNRFFIFFLLSFFLFFFFFFPSFSLLPPEVRGINSSDLDDWGLERRSFSFLREVLSCLTGN